MAISPAHTWGQILGNIVEDSVRPILEEIAEQHDLYLDYVRDRPARPRKTVTWSDEHGNDHDLDYVFEQGGTEEQIGAPVGFVEVAWRRYTKHSKNKVQEIQGAVMPIAAKHADWAPFMGAILAGMFTTNALEQLRTNGFEVLYIPYERVVASFESVGIAASSEETSEEQEYIEKIETWDALSADQKDEVKKNLLASCESEIDLFVRSLERAVGRIVERVIIFPLFGESIEFLSFNDASRFLRDGSIEPTDQPTFVRIEIQVRYNNSDVVKGSFASRHTALSFLRRISSSDI